MTESRTRRFAGGIGSALLAALLLGLLPAVTFAEKATHTYGISVILKGDVQSARQRALDKAFGDALEESVTSVAQAQNMASFQEILEEIRTEDPLTYVDKYRIMSDVRDRNVYKVEIEAWISEEKVKQRLADIGLIRYQDKVVEVGILMRTRTDERIESELASARGFDFNGFAVQQYRTRGFEVVKGTVSVDSSLEGLEKLRLNNRLTALQGRRLGADAVILGLVDIQMPADPTETRPPEPVEAVPPGPTGTMLPEPTETVLPEPTETVPYGQYQVSLWLRAVRSSDGSLIGIRETSFTPEPGVSIYMLRQEIRQQLDALFAGLGETIREYVQ
jgi:hypothetical protein